MRVCVLPRNLSCAAFLILLTTSATWPRVVFSSSTSQPAVLEFDAEDTLTLDATNSTTTTQPTITYHAHATSNGGTVQLTGNETADIVIPATQPAEHPSAPLPWLSKFSDALDESRRSRQPILVEVGADWCVSCRELDAQMGTEAVQGRLPGFTLLRLDADRDADSIHNLAVGPLPALRVLSPGGQMLAWHNGYMNGDELAAWLDAHAPAAVVPPPELDGAGAPDAASVDKIVQELTDRDPLVHGAAVRRLMPYPNQAAGKVAAAFAEGKLRQRLAARELLAAWKAPVQSLDPWKPESITPDALAALKQWAGQKHEPPTAGSLTGEDLDIARHDIGAMLQTTDPAEVESARERLARFGPALLPEIYAALKSSATDRDHERLMALRYRVVATQTLALHWPGGFDRLASGDTQVRHPALDELGQTITSADAPLLMELFSDPDPLMRETSLKLLQSVGGGNNAGGLVRLLHDPDANVRAAVLKQLAETPDPHMVPEVVKYLAAESDSDLVVHAIRFLREAKGGAAIDCLLSLVGNPSWRVRAEAAEALGTLVEQAGSDQYQAARQTQIYSAMLKLLDDPDGFVVSRALGVLKSAREPAIIAAVIKVGDKRPELIPDIVKVLSAQGGGYVSSNDGQPNVTAAMETLRKYCSNKDVAVRIAAITALGTNATSAEFLPALNDASSSLRVAGAKVVMELLEQERSTGQRTGIMADDWLNKFRAGKGRPDWAAGVMEPLRAMLKSGTPAEQLSAALPLVALSDDKEPIACLRDAIANQPNQRHRIASVLPWLPTDARLELFGVFRAATAGDPRMLGTLASYLATSPSEKSASALWDLLKDESADLSVTAQVEQSLIRAYTGAEYWNVRNGSGDLTGRGTMIETSKKMAANGAANQRIAALALLLTVSPEDAATSSRQFLDTGAGGDGLRIAALQVLLLSQTRDDGLKTAIPLLAMPGPLKRIAVQYIAAGAEPLQTIGGELYLNSFNMEIRFRSFDAYTPFAVNSPPGVTKEMLQPLLKDPDPEVAAYTGYLLSVQGDFQGVEPLYHYWQTHPDDQTLRRLAYRALVLTNDDTLTPDLEAIYASFGKHAYEVTDFYWTLAAMKGDRVNKLRKRINEETKVAQPGRSEF